MLPTSWIVEDIGMADGATAARLLLEAARARSASPATVGQDLDRDVTASRVARPVDLAHATRTERRGDLVGAEPRAGDQRHASGSIRRPGRWSLYDASRDRANVRSYAARGGVKDSLQQAVTEDRETHGISEIDRLVPANRL